jgi:hypothetical protein
LAKKQENNKSEFDAWYNSYYTRFMFEEIADRRKRALEYLAVNLLPEAETNFMRGQIRSYDLILDTRWEE